MSTKQREVAPHAPLRRARSKISHWCLTDVGVRRSHNQDSFGVTLAPNEESWLSRGHLYVVADGMGAHAVGELASKMAADVLQHAYTKSRIGSPKEALKASIEEANRSIREKARQNPDFKGMGTTITALVLLPEGAIIGHVGDSRCYRVRAGKMEQITQDHSVHWETARKRGVDPDEVKDVPKNVLSRSLGNEDDIQVDVDGPYEVANGDRFLICSDGLSGHLTDVELGAINAELPPGEAAPLMIEMSNMRGGVDNITLILVEIGEAAVTPPPKRSLIFWRGWGGPALTVLLGIISFPIAYLLHDLAIGGALYVGLAGVILFVAGMSWLLAVSEKKEKKEDKEVELPPPIHRVTNSTVDDALTSHLHDTVNRISRKVRESQWPTEWDAFEEHCQRADESYRSGDLHEAFREYCRSLAVLGRAVKQHRHKQEVFDPNWETKRRPSPVKQDGHR
ncbi:Serine/threonine phosphatase stp [Planctomycetes bacterium Pan216]|uniref:Serine/threonine phosphatase stp n=1 Tax=Kolteria novifilia TaxID=2527975 RepID=A0A518BA87_9BACT|nr:Serine/threonine phosphatase stp [Planctomycetes bacterium Pan216]